MDKKHKNIFIESTVFDEKKSGRKSWQRIVQQTMFSHKSKSLQISRTKAVHSKKIFSIAYLNAVVNVDVKGGNDESRESS